MLRTLASASLIATAGAMQLAATSLTQGDAVPIKKIMKKSSESYTESVVQMGALQEQLAAMNAQNLGEANQEKQAYDEQLQEIKHNVTAKEHENAKVVRDIRALDVEIAGLRAAVDPLTERNKVMHEELVQIQSHIGLVQEFLTASLESSEENASVTPDLRVISELENEDLAQKRALAHQQSLEFIAKKTTTKKVIKKLPTKLAKKIALLQTQFPVHDKKHLVKETHDGEAKGILTTLASSLQQMMDEQAVSQQAMKEAFEEEYANHTTKLDKLAEEFISLNATRVAKTERVAKLKVAVSHLKTTSKSLTKRRESLVNFGNKLAARPDPIKLLQEKKAAKLHSNQNASSLETQPVKATSSWSLLR